jgi:hypothetical protein
VFHLSEEDSAGNCRSIIIRRPRGITSKYSSSPIDDMLVPGVAKRSGL